MWQFVTSVGSLSIVDTMGDLELDFDISMGDCTSGLSGDYSNLNTRMEKQIEGETQDSESDESSM